MLLPKTWEKHVSKATSEPALPWVSSSPLQLCRLDRMLWSPVKPTELKLVTSGQTQPVTALQRAHESALTRITDLSFGLQFPCSHSQNNNLLSFPLCEFRLNLKKKKTSRSYTISTRNEQGVDNISRLAPKHREQPSCCLPPPYHRLPYSSLLRYLVIMIFGFVDSPSSSLSSFSIHHFDMGSGP